MFKSEWEKTQTRVQIEDRVILQMLKSALLCRSDYGYEQMAGGCANLNYKIYFADDSKPLLLRIYIRDPESAYREQKISELFNNNSAVPVAKVFFVGDCEGYRYAIVQYILGVSLRDLLLHYDSAEWGELVRDAGNMLAAVGKIEFPVAGFFDTNLKVTKPFVGKGIGDEIETILNEPLAKDRLGLERMRKIQEIFLTHGALLPDATHHHLVHGDFDPSNILVEKHHDRWRIAALLDWEFAFSGSRLWDVSNMLRYAHRMPAVYQELFLKGLQDAGVVLPDQWENIIHMLSLVSLIEAVARGNPADSPNQYKDMYRLIDYQIEQLKN